MRKRKQALSDATIIIFTRRDKISTSSDNAVVPNVSVPCQSAETKPSDTTGEAAPSISEAKQRHNPAPSSVGVRCDGSAHSTGHPGRHSRDKLTPRVQSLCKPRGDTTRVAPIGADCAVGMKLR